MVDTYRYLHHGVKEVQPILITNTRSDFTEQVPKCSFGILYHSKTRGRLNITDVVSSLYDDELQHLSQAYGRNNVIVVVGDVEDSSNEKKAFILREQPKLDQYASDVFLFNEVKDSKAPFEGSKIEDLKNKIKKRVIQEFYKRSFIGTMSRAMLLPIVIVAVSAHKTSHFISNMMTTPPPSTIANIISTLTSQRMNATAQLLGNITSAVEAKP
ncbi:uncharacterized protein [Aquarana catesbeiana]|uniref:uncharacterized protein isoform X3 n=1 Tax=Aquarana catesbeiana TaxID=8400 RepID=UPI003CC9BC7E